MKRDVYKKLLEWKKSKRRKPLILRGARQVGKTYILKEFGEKEYANQIYINFEEDTKIKEVFSEDLTVEKIIEYLEIYSHQKITPGQTLLFFDEIQSSPQILKSLKYFNEKFNEYHIVTAGSLLGVSLSGAQSFPVGKVNFLDIYPLSFEEFASAIGKSKMLSLLPELKKSQKKVPEPFHKELIELLKLYYYIGGMPEVVSDYIENKDLDMVREIQKEILTSYKNDFSKHCTKSEALKIRQIWESIPLHLSKENKNFILSAVKSSARAREYETALQWLIDAGLIIKVSNISKPLIPLTAYIEKQFKVYLLDVGLLGAQTNLTSETLLFKNELFTHFKGALVENYVMQQLFPYKELFYWCSNGKAEIDLIINIKDKVCPIEIKAGMNLKAKSLILYQKKYNPDVLFRCSTSNFNVQNNLFDCPLYAVTQIMLVK